VFVKTIGTEHFRGPRAGVLLLGLGGHLQNFDPKSLGQSDQGSKLAGGSVPRPGAVLSHCELSRIKSGLASIPHPASAI
jgi:hypothetical protein